MEVILLRHGATAGNLLHQYIGRTDQPLAPEGEALARRRTLPAPDLLFVSPMLRCRQTAALIWPETEQILVPDLRETDFGAFEAKTWADLKDDPTYRAWIDGVGECPDGEQRQAVARRMLLAAQACLTQALHANAQRCAIVAHGGTVMHLLHETLGNTFYHWQSPLCGGWQVTVAEDGSFSDPRPLPDLTPKD